MTLARGACGLGGTCLVGLDLVGESGVFINRMVRKRKKMLPPGALSVLPRPSISVVSSYLESLSYYDCDMLSVSLRDRSMSTGISTSTMHCMPTAGNI